MPQVKTMLNLMRCSCIDPTKSAYEVLHGKYDWNHFPLAPPGCKAVIYESPAQRGSWGSRGIDAWYVGPSLDHYQCCHYFVPETRAYCISGSAELFPQHCQVPCLTTGEHLRGLTNKMVATLKTMTEAKQWKVLTLLNAKLANHNNPPSSDIATHPLHEWMLPDDDPQRLPPMLYNAAGEQRVAHTLPEQRVPMPSSLRRITNAPPIMAAPNPTNKRMIKMTLRSHVRVTCNNIPDSVPAIRHQAPVCPNPAPPPKNTTPRRSLRVPKVKFAAIPGGLHSGKLI